MFEVGIMAGLRVFFGLADRESARAVRGCGGSVRNAVGKATERVGEEFAGLGKDFRRAANYISVTVADLVGRFNRPSNEGKLASFQGRLRCDTRTPTVDNVIYGYHIQGPSGQFLRVGNVGSVADNLTGNIDGRREFFPRVISAILNAKGDLRFEGAYHPATAPGGKPWIELHYINGTHISQLAGSR